MSLVLLALFAVMLGCAMLAALIRPGLAVAIAVGTYGLEQIATIPVPFFAAHQSAFNLLVAAMVAGSLFVALLSHLPSFKTHEAYDASLLIWGFLVLYWTSTLWSPTGDPMKIWVEVPYFAIYVLILPLLVRGPREMIRSFRILWAVLAVGFLGTLLSPMFMFSIALGRAVVATTGNAADQGENPLAFADAAALLALTSTMLIFAARTLGAPRPRWRGAWTAAFVVSGLVGFWSAFISGRGETVACLISGIVLVVLIRSGNLAAVVQRLILGVVFVFAIGMVVFGKYGEQITSFSPRFAEASLSSSVSIRGELQRACFDASTETVSRTLVGLGAGGCEERVGLYPHSELLQAFMETGIVGFVLLVTCYLFVLSFGIRTLARAKQLASRESVIAVSFFLSLLLYELLVANKKGTLTYPDSYMWLALSVMSFDRAQAYMRSQVTASPLVANQVHAS